MRRWQSLGSSVLLCVLLVAGRAEAEPRTIAHEILDIEAKAMPVNASHYALLDAIIAEAKVKLPPTDTMPPGSSGDARKAALQRLEIIDRILIDRRFIYPGGKMKLVAYLSEGLTPRELSKEEFQDSRESFHNIRRMAMMDAAPRKPFFVVDCDIASFIYLAIGETLHLPISLVEAPGHNFVRWTFPDGSHLNFETMDGEEMSDADYRQSYWIPNDIIKPGLMMIALSRDDVMGYVRYLRGRAWEDKGDYAEARRDYVESVRLRPATPEARDYLALSYATCPSTSCRDSKLALKLAQENVAIWRRPIYLDTLACAYAADGDFVTALRQAKEVAAFSDDYANDLEAIRSGTLCSPVAAAVLALEATPTTITKIPPRRIIGNR